MHIIENTGKRKTIWLRTALFVYIMLFIFVIHSVELEASETVIGASIYQSSDNSAYNSNSRIDKFSYGKSSLGKFSTPSGVKKGDSHKGYNSIGATSDFTIGYIYDGSYHSKEKEDWNLTDSSQKSVNGVSLSKKVKCGSVIVQRSFDGKNWETVIEENDVFKKNSKGVESLYTVTKDEILCGTYYRVLVAYDMRRKNGTEPGIGGTFIGRKDIYEVIECLEKYEFFVFYDGNPVTFHSISDGSDVANKQTIDDGFAVDLGKSNCIVSYSCNEGAVKNASDGETINTPGKYKLSIKTVMGKVYNYEITISEGTVMTSLSPVVYEGGKNGKYEEESPTNGDASFGLKSLSTLSIGCDADTRISNSKKDGFDVYGVSGDSVGLYLKLVKEDILRDNGYEVVYDDYGKRNSQKICDSYTGEIGTGALIIKKSLDGNDWIDVEASRYSNGIFTTDYYSNYGNRGDVLVYTPDGEEINKGIYLKVLLAYNVYSEESKKTNRCLESYSFYLCNNQLGAVTFHNKSVDEPVIRENVGADKEANIEIYKRAETLVSGSGTVSGFEVDTSTNPTVVYSIEKDGQVISKPENNTFTDPGKYEVNLTSAAGDTDKVIIFVDKQTSEESLKTYFGSGFIDTDKSKRIFSTGSIPVFEAGKTFYHIEGRNQQFLPLTGRITNTTSGKIIKEFRSVNSEENGSIDEPGIYEAVFTTASNLEGEDLCGDYRVFTYRFEIIAEGTAPGPKENEEKLAEYASTNVSDAYPMYYCLIYQNAAGHDIRLAFTSREAAVEYAYNYEKGTVEPQGDGTYRYTGNSSNSLSNSGYDSLWDLTEDINDFAENQVQEMFFDVSNEYTYITLSDDIISQTGNLRKLELQRTVTVWEKGSLHREEPLPVISPKPFAIIDSENGNPSTGHNDFAFIHDKYGCDSNSVVITDVYGNEYNIEYGEGVGEQLQNYGCTSGIVTIRETTVYGDQNEYQAIFIADGQNTSNVEISYYSGDAMEKKSVSQDSSGTLIQADAFRISGLSDDLDPYNLIRINKPNGDVVYQVSDQLSRERWFADEGTYTVSVINRLGFSYSFSVDIAESDYAVITFVGNGTDDISDILTKYGEKSVKLPIIERKGYTLVAFQDQNDDKYPTDKVEKVEFKGNMFFRPRWETNIYSIIVKNYDGSLLADDKVKYGEIYELPVVPVGEGYSFDGWKCNGSLIKENSIFVDGDMTLSAQVSSDEANEPESSEVRNDSSLPVAFIGVLVAGVGAGIVISKKKKNKKEDAHENDNGDAEEVEQSEDKNVEDDYETK